jgi:hypothetical protein
MTGDRILWTTWLGKSFGKKWPGNPLLWAGLISIWIGAGCQDYRFIPYDESKPVPTPDVETVRSKSAEGSSAIRRFGDPYADAGQAGGAGDVIASGVITLDPRLQGKVDSSHTLYIIARNFGEDQPPMPLAVQKFTGVRFPLHYQLTRGDIMIKDMEVGNRISVDVLYDRDGDPMTKDDLLGVGAYPGNPVPPGSGNLDIVLKRPGD